MSDKTKIEWTDATWNPVTGCTRVSPGCTNCYIDWAPPFRIEGRHFTVPCEHCGGTGFEPMTGKFRDSHTCSICKGEGEHTFQVLTKRHGRMRVLLKSWDFRILVHDAVTELNGAEHDEVWPPPNVWVGVTVEDQQHADLRIPALLATPAAVRFLSCEPLLGPVTLHQDRLGGRRFLDGIDWVIAGGESKDARPMHPDWARSLRDQCQTAGVPFLFKQWGEWVTEDQAPEDITLPGISWSHLGDGGPSVYKVGKKAGRELDGRTGRIPDQHSR